ncbi:MAG: Hsp20/alpha crystallin family protein [Chloroflexota bacterium]
MATVRYNNLVDLANLVNQVAFNQTAYQSKYDYARNGGSAKEPSTEGETSKPRINTARLPLDVQETNESLVLTAYLPGVPADAVEITVEGEELRIRGEFPSIPEETKFLKRELFHGAFERNLQINVPIDVESIEAVSENGILTLSLPKAEVVKPKQIAILAK